MKKILVGILILCMILPMAGCSKAKDSVTISMDEFNEVLANYQQMYKNKYGEETYKSSFENNEQFQLELKKYVLESTILEKVLLEKAHKANINASNESIDSQVKSIKDQYQSEEQYKDYLTQSNITEEQLKEKIATNLTIQEYLTGEKEKLNTIEISENDMKKYYDENTDAFNKVKASHILVEKVETAKEVITKLNDGGDFAELAKEYSICVSKDDGGNLGYFAYNDMVPQFSAVAFKLKVGETSRIVQTEYGYHIIRVTDRIEKYEDANKDDIKNAIIGDKYNELIDSYVENAVVSLPKELEEIRNIVIEQDTQE